LGAIAWSESQKRDDGIPETVTIDVLSKKYLPVNFPHQSHAEMSGDCVTCHHHSPAGKTSACSKCHSIKPSLKKDDVPSLKAAYHLQCIDCHRQQDIELSRCAYCHAKKQISSKPIVKGSEK
jgi:DnaJ-class molecular chaperone